MHPALLPMHPAFFKNVKIIPSLSFSFKSCYFKKVVGCLVFCHIFFVFSLGCVFFLRSVSFSEGEGVGVHCCSGWFVGDGI